MKNRLYVVYGGKWDAENEDFAYKADIKYMTFKNREKALNCIDNLLDGYMKTKAYSHNYRILDEYYLDSPMKTMVTDIVNKYEAVVYSVELVEIDLSNIIM